MRRVTAVGFVFLFFATAAGAQTDSKGNIAFGFSYARGNLSPKSALAPTIGSSNLNGWFSGLGQMNGGRGIRVETTKSKEDPRPHSARGLLPDVS